MSLFVECELKFEVNPAKYLRNVLYDLRALSSTGFSSVGRYVDTNGEFIGPSKITGVT